MEEDEYFASQKELNEQSELYLKALQEYNRREVLMKRLQLKKNIEKMRMGEYFKILNELLDAETDEELDVLLRALDEISKMKGAGMR